MNKDLIKSFVLWYLTLAMFVMFLILIVIFTTKHEAYSKDPTKEETVPLDINLKLLYLECGIQRPIPPDTFVLYEKLANGLETYHFDTDHNNFADAMIAIPQGDTNRYPLFYYFSIHPPEQEPNIIWVDKARDGTCDGVEIYWSNKNRKKLDAQAKL